MSNVSYQELLRGRNSDQISVLMRIDESTLTFLTDADNDVLEWGDGDRQVDMKWYGSVAARYAHWDASAEALRFEDNVDLRFGTGDDVEVRWDGTDLDILAGADDLVIKFGNGTNSFDLWVYGNAAADYLLWDASASALDFRGAVRIDFSNANPAAANTDGAIIKAGTAAAPLTESTADLTFIKLFFKNAATSGDNRGIYNRLYLAGAGGGGESLRTFTTVDNVAAGTAHGAHISLNFNATGSITGLGVASRNTLHIANAASPAGGTYAATQAEIYSDGASSDPTNVTELSFIRVINDGNATGIGKVDDKANFVSFIGGAAGAGNMIGAVGNEPTWASKTHLIRCKLPDGTALYLVAVIL